LLGHNNIKRVKFPFLIALYLSLAIQVHAQLLQITAYGVVDLFSNDPSVPLGTDVTLTYSFPLDTPVLQTTPGVILYGSTQAPTSASVQVGTTDLTSSDAYITVYTLPTYSQYGYIFQSSLNDAAGFQSPLATVNLIGDSPSLVPSTALSDIGEYPLSDFNVNDTFGMSYGPDSGNDLTGTITSYSVEEAPEPSTYVMMLGGLVLLGFCVRRKTVLLS